MEVRDRSRVGNGDGADAAGVILVCDGDSVHRELVRASLELGGYDLFEVGDCHLLVGSAAAIAPDLIILEPGAPGSDGLDELRALRVSPEGARLPVLVLTTGVGRRQRAAALAAGADSFLAKPFSPRELASTVARLIQAPGPTSTAFVADTAFGRRRS